MLPLPAAGTMPLPVLTTEELLVLYSCRKAVEAIDEGAPSSVPPKGETINIKDEGSSWKRLDAVQARACMEIFKDNGSCCISLVHYIVQPAILFI